MFHKVDPRVIGFGYLIGHVIKEYLTHHHSMLSQYLGQLACVDACDTRNVFSLEPFGQSLYAVPVTVLSTVIAYNDGASMDFVTLHELRKSIFTKFK